ncbi:MAG TPA: DUF1549 and DUF1553 domain-containing protein [Fimbriiglobus sp.]|nr:DUF1549 and DUF1553 domain-containing protein [Fimbriiglobus sp.]
MPPARLLAPALLVALLAGPAAARPAHKQALAEYFGPFLARKLHDCRTCHLPDKPGQTAEDDKPHNPFGERLAEVKYDLRQAKKPTAIADRIRAVADEDSDADGVPNLTELLTGHNPGDPADTPTREQLAEYPAKLADFHKFLASYPWRPFDPVRRPAVPKPSAWGRNPIDSFIAAKHEEHGLKPRPEAERSILLRRVYLDLIGLPPTPEEQNAYLHDTAPDAYEKVVDQLLASPQYGERWGRHWMDVWRYSDWAGWGQQVRDSQPHIWRWRDWIVESLNKDKPYDRMVREMLAGDEIAPADPDTLRATGYLVRNFKLLSREKWMQDTVDHTFQAFLGVTIGCARCHDHMYDPIAQKEYYRVRAIFEPHQVRIDRIPGQPDTAKDGLPRVYDANLTVPTYFYVRGDERTPDKSASLLPGVPARLGGTFTKIAPVELPLAARAPDRRPFVVRETLAASEAALGRAETKAVVAHRKVIAVTVPEAAVLSPLSLAVARRTGDTAELARQDAAIAGDRHAALEAVLKVEAIEDAGETDSSAWKEAAKAAVVAQRTQAVAEAKRELFARERGLAPPPKKGQKPPALDALRKAVVAAEANAAKPPTTAYTKRKRPTYPAESTGRRTALAKWITASANPLFARVAMNHIWLRHFGRGIVPSPADFGRNGQRPTHPALLDWLAAEFVARGWSMKQMHRLIVTSATYRQASTPNGADLAADPDDVYLWRMPSRRLEAEVVRDQLFYVAGQFDLTMGGPDIDHTKGLTVPRRSLYFQHAAEKQMPFLKLFDCAAVTECYERHESVTPQQALALANSELTARHAKLLARDLHAKAPSESAFVAAAFRRVLARPPTAEEAAECETFLKQDDGPRAREGLVRVLMNHHDFVTVR